MATANLESLCRICLEVLSKKPSESFKFEDPLEKYNDTTFSEAFLSCTGCHIQPNEPQRMCLPCGTELMLAFDLRVKCYQTQEVLEKLLTVEEPVETVEEESENVFLEVVDYQDVYDTKEDIKPLIVCPPIPNPVKNVIKSVPIVKKIKSPSISCPYCSFFYESSTALRFHCELSHPEQKVHECPTCHQKFFAVSYESHLKKCEKAAATKNQPKPGRKNYSAKQLCPVCAEMRNPHHIQWHIQRAQNPDADGNIITHPYICDICGARKTAKCYIIQHMRNEHLNQLLKCRHCPAEFKHPSTLYAHERREHSDKVPLLKCKFCEFQTATHSSLRVHTYSKHTGEKKHKCDICFASFVTKWKLREHSACHSNETPHVCEICNGKFKTREGVRRHQTKVHKFYKSPKYMKA